MNREVTLLHAGDLYLNRTDPESMFAGCASYFKEADLVVGNLEAQISDVGDPSPAKESLKMRSPEGMLAGYASAGFDALVLANNHSIDFGPESLLRSIELLDKAGIAHAGGGRNREEAHRPAILERNGTRIAILNYSSVNPPAAKATDERAGIATVRVSTAYEPHPRVLEVPGSPALVHTIPNADDAKVLEADIMSAKENADVVIVSWHWGVSPASGGTGQLVGYQVELAHRAIDAGADLVIGHHPHSPQAIEVYQGKAIFYSLGDFAFERLGGGTSAPNIIARCVVQGGEVREVSFVPSRPGGQREPLILRTSEAEDVLKMVQDHSAQFGTKFRVTDGSVVVETRVAVRA
jgi:poly-gamma-glutamate synthesis protein (capsule biosynthesis protein)